MGTKPDGPLPQSGELRRIDGPGPDSIAWRNRAVKAAGLPLLGRSFADAGKHWPMLAFAALLFFIALNAVVLRWKLILDVQGLKLPWGKAWAITFIGHFFNSFLFGATGGDVVKAYYAARETGHMKTEAVATVFIDRVVGLLGLIVLTGGIVAIRFRFYLQYKATRYALVFMVLVMAGTLVALAAMFAARPLLRWIPFARRLLATRPGSIVKRAYLSFYLVLTHPSLLAKGMLLSMMNHFLLIVIAWSIGRALLVDRPFIDFVSVIPTVSAIGAIPITPGGLGIRESAMIVYLGIVHVPATQALPLSLLMYAISLIWSLFGGIVFMLFSGGGRGLAADMAQAALPEDEA